MIRSGGVVYENGIPFLVRLLGCRFRDSRRSFRMKWGELSIRPGWACQICLFGDGPHFSLNLHLLRIQVFVTLGFLNRFAFEPHEMMEAWGASCSDGSIHFHWRRHTKIWTFPWCDWMQVGHDVRRPDGSWAPFVGSWECARPLDDGTFRPGKEPDLRHLESYPYRYMLRSGEVQQRTATIYVERRIRRLRWLRALPMGKTSHAISVEFNDEVGERTGSWKGGTIGCGWELRPNETPRECLSRMESERKF